ncbi:hypothetical protein [Bacteroides acidifaciens]|uniref:hypothetical protein n=1 Tax=Bacteroides acidifaciens TaxID=85831 RepID=UPI00258B3B08|nr:hypothetical protein [Bacteroides acidifaciens]
MELIEYVKLATAFIVSIGGASVVVIGLAKWFGDFLSKRLLDSYNNKHEQELEGIKNKYAKELEETKSTIEKAKMQYARYSEKQFESYNSLWKILLYTKQQADMLWEKLEPSQIPAFSEQIRLTKDAINDNLLLIEEEHYVKLLMLIEKFEQLQFGKVKLVDVRGYSSENERISLEETRITINQNKTTKDNYDKLILDIGKSFRTQLKG